MAAKKKQTAKVGEKKRRKAVRKDKGILIRVTEAQKKALAEAAAAEALGVSSWMLAVAMREIERKANAAVEVAAGPCPCEQCASSVRAEVLQ